MAFHSLMQDWGELMLLSYSLTQSFMCRPNECLFGYNRHASDTRSAQNSWINWLAGT
jgi:hypothetical protein